MEAVRGMEIWQPPGREIANKEKISWIEYWPWLGEFLDLSSESGLQLLEEYLEEKTRSIREKSDQEYQHDMTMNLKLPLL